MHDRPIGDQIELALIRLPAPAAADRVGSLVVNPGGPGGSGVDFVRSSAVAGIPAAVRARFDIVGFDPRGVARSGGLECGDEPQRAPLRGFLSTADVSRHLDLIRRAAGDRQLTHLSFSYGSTIGLTYAQQFPQRLRTMVLDGLVDTALDGRRNVCTDRFVSRYLVDLVLPPPDTSCG